MAAIPQQEVSPPPPGLAPRRRFQPLTNPEETNVDDRVYGKSFLLDVKARMAVAAAPPAELAGLTCRQMLRAPRRQETSATGWSE